MKNDKSTPEKPDYVAIQSAIEALLEPLNQGWTWAYLNDDNERITCDQLSSSISTACNKMLGLALLLDCIVDDTSSDAQSAIMFTIDSLKEEHEKLCFLMPYNVLQCKFIVPVSKI